MVVPLQSRFFCLKDISFFFSDIVNLWIASGIDLFVFFTNSYILRARFFV